MARNLNVTLHPYRFEFHMHLADVNLQGLNDLCVLSLASFWNSRVSEAEWTFHESGRHESIKVRIHLALHWMCTIRQRQQTKEGGLKLPFETQRKAPYEERCAVILCSTKLTGNAWNFVLLRLTWGDPVVTHKVHCMGPQQVENIPHIIHSSHTMKQCNNN